MARRNVAKTERLLERDDLPDDLREKNQKLLLLQRIRVVSLKRLMPYIVK